MNQLIKKISGKVPLRIIMVLPFVLQILTAVGLVGYLSFRNGQQSVEDLETQLRQEIVNRIQDRLKSYLSKPHAINQINAKDLEIGKLNLQEISGLERHFYKQIELFDWARYIYFGSDKHRLSSGAERAADGKINLGYWDGKSAQIGFYTYGTNEQGDRAKIISVIENNEVLNRPWYRAALKAEKAAWGEIYVWTAPYPNVALPAVKPVYEAPGQMIGVFAVDLSLLDISHFLASLKVGRTGQTFIMEPNGLLVATSTSQLPFITDNGEPQRLQAIEADDALIKSTAAHLLKEFGDFNLLDETKQLAFELNGDRQLVQVTPYRDQWGLEWTIVVVVPEADFMARINANTRTTIGLCVAALGVATLLGLLTARWIAKPILRLGEASRTIAREGIKQNLEVYKDRPVCIAELRSLADAFKQMAMQLSQSFLALEESKEQLEERVEERTAQLAAAEAELRDLFEAMTELVIVFDAEGRHLKIASINPSLLYESYTEKLGKKLSEVFAPEIVDTFLGYIEQALSSKRTLNVEYCLAVSERGEIWCAASISPISDNSVIWVAWDITSRKQAERALALEAARDNLLSQISRAFIDQDLDTAINLALQLMGEFTECDRSYVMGYDQKQYSVTHGWRAAGIEPLIDQVQGIPESALSWFHQQYQSGQTIKICSPADFPPIEADAEKALLEQYGIQATLHVPMLHLDKLVGFIGLDCGSTKDWTEEDIKMLELVGEIIAIARARHAVEQALRLEQEKSEQLLLNILPEPIAAKLKQSQEHIAENFEEVTIMFADIVGFTPLSARLEPIALVNLLNKIFSTFDALASELGLEKIKTIGDAYMVAAGLPIPKPDHAEAIADMALAMQTAVNNFQVEVDNSFQIRVGINSGVVVAGVIGIKKFIYDLWGDAVNVASRMESSGEPGRIQVTAATHKLLLDKYLFEERGKISVKGKGEMTTYWLIRKKS
ncbi:MAG: GAF domain-containing protein [Hormoscilla sp. SP5CHS1]|nr:GAF domain-containing protein [Hormoscilla sp. SP5CHS1]